MPKYVKSQYRKITKATKTEGFYIGDQSVCCASNRRGVAFGVVAHRCVDASSLWQLWRVERRDAREPVI